MAVGIRIKLPGVTQEQFDKVNEHVMGSGDMADGMIFHSSGPIDGGWGVIDFWESRADFDAFFGSRVKAAVDASGIDMQGGPDVKEFAVHEYIKA
jgi:heme-degrading monooxygenase HmoA